MRCPFVCLRGVLGSVSFRENKAGRIVSLLKDVESSDSGLFSTGLSIGQGRCQKCLHLIGLNFYVNVNNQHAARISLRRSIERRNYRLKSSSLFPSLPGALDGAEKTDNIECMAVAAATTSSKRPSVPRKYGPTQVERWLFGAWTALVFAFLYIPMLLLIVFSFNSSRLNIRWEGFSLKWYAALLENRALLTAFQNSLIVAAVTTILATLLGTMGAWMLYRYRFPFQRTIGFLIFIPMVIPEVLMGASLLAEFVHLLKLPLGYTTLIIAHTTFCFPFVLVGVQARLQGLDPFLEEAALDLGATPIQAFWLIILPYLTPAIVAGALMSFTLSLDEYIVSVFTTGPHSQTLPLKVYGMAKVGLNPQLNALSTIFVVATVVLVLLSELLTRRKSS